MSTEQPNDMTAMGGRDNHIATHLVELYDFQQINNKALDKGEELVGLVTTLLDMDLNPHESELVADVLINLLRQIENNLRIALSERLSIMETVPLRLVLHLAGENIAIAEPILKHSPIFSDMDLIYIIKSKDALYWRAIAQREKLGQQVSNTLVSTGDIETAINLTENENIELSEYAIDTLVSMAQSHDDIAQPLLNRSEITQDIIRSLYSAASVAIKHHIEDNFEGSLQEITPIMDEVTTEFTNASLSSGASQEPEQTHIQIAQRYKERGMLTIDLMLKTLKRGQFALFVAEMSIYTDLPAAVILDLMLQGSGQGLAILCQHCDILKQDFISIYLLIKRSKFNGAMVNPKDLNRAIEYFDRIDKNVANMLVKQSIIKNKGK